MQASKAFFEAERRYNYTTPKTFLELIKLYKSVLTGKRKQSQEAIDRCDWHPFKQVVAMWVLAADRIRSLQA